MVPAQIIAAVVSVLIMAGFVFNFAAILTWLDRRQGAVIQDRVGPNRAVIKIGKLEIRLAGLLHPLADGLKFFWKEDFMPPKADKLLFALGPIVVLAPVLALLAVIPFGDTLCLDYLWRTAKDGATYFPAVPRHGVCAGNAAAGIVPIELQVAALNPGILYVFGIMSLGVVGAGLAGYASDNKFSLMGALRASSQMVSYEVMMGLSLIGPMMIYGTVRMGDMVRWQGDNTWGIFVQPVAFFVFLTAITAESERIPFDLPEAESELVSGFFTEYPGMKFGMFYFAEYMKVITSSMLIATLFLGGWQVPFLHRDGITVAVGDQVLLHQLLPHVWVTILQVLTFFGKVLFLCWLMCFVRWSLPRFRYDQLMALCWKVCLPISLANILVTGIVYLGIDGAPDSVKNALKVAGDLSQAFVFLAVNYFFLRVIAFYFFKGKYQRDVVGSAARQAQAAGGTKASPMQA